MTVSSTTRKAGPFACDGSQVAFPFDFKVFAAADVLVVYTDAAGVETTLTLTTDYTVSLNADQNANPGGTVTTGTAYAVGEKITLGSQVAQSQTLDLTVGGDFNPSNITDALDRQAILTQQLAEEVDRSVKVGFSSDVSPDQLLASIMQAAADSSASATAAASSETAAAGSATSAGNSATQAAASAAQAIAATGGRLVSVQAFQVDLLNPTTEQAVTLPSGLSSSAFLLVELQGAGGSGAAATAAGSQASAGGGGGGGGYILAKVAVSALVGSPVVVVGKGADAATAGASGTAGADTIFRCKLLGSPHDPTVTAYGGGGGTAMTTGTSVKRAAGGAGGESGFSGTGTIIKQVYGTAGRAGARMSGTMALGGDGGPSTLGIISRGGVLDGTTGQDGEYQPGSNGHGGGGAVSASTTGYDGAAGGHGHAIVYIYS